MGDSQEPDTRPQFEVVSDEDWKEKVKAEDARLDAERSQGSTGEQAQQSEQDGIDPRQIPPASFQTLVTMFSTQAMVALGALGDPSGEESRVQLPLARHFIDLLAVLEEKCRGNLDENERLLLESSLHQLRLAYLEISRSQ